MLWGVVSVIAFLATALSVWLYTRSQQGQEVDIPVTIMVTEVPDLQPLEGDEITPTPRTFIGTGEDIPEFVQRLIDEKKLVSQELALPSVPDDVTYNLVIPSDLEEVTQEESEKWRYLIRVSAEIFEQTEGITHNDLNTEFRHPGRHDFILLNRTAGLPNIVLESGQGTALYTDLSGQLPPRLISVINLDGPMKTLGREYTNAWGTIQAVCVGFTHHNPDSDSICNVLAANAAAGWLSLDPAEAEAYINGLGVSHSIESGGKGYKHRWISYVYDMFQKWNMSDDPTEG